MKTIALFFTSVLIITGIRAQSFSVTYSFDSVKTTTGTTDPTPVLSPPGVSFGQFCSVGVSANPNAGVRFSFTGWPAGALNGAASYASLSGAVDTSKYFQVMLSPDPSYSMDLSSISFSLQRSSTGIRTYVVRSSADGFKSNLTALISPADTNLTVESANVFFINKDITTIRTGSTIKLGGAAFTGIASSIRFRFYAYNAESAAGTFSLDNVLISGTANVATAIVNTPKSEISLYPNPSATGIFFVELSTPASQSTLVVYDMLGRSVFNTSIRNAGRIPLDLSDSPSGRYVILIRNEREVMTKTVIVNK